MKWSRKFNRIYCILSIILWTVVSLYRISFNIPVVLSLLLMDYKCNQKMPFIRTTYFDHTKMDFFKIIDESIYLCYGMFNICKINMAIDRINLRSKLFLENNNFV